MIVDALAGVAWAVSTALAVAGDLIGCTVQSTACSGVPSIGTTNDGAGFVGIFAIPVTAILLRFAARRAAQDGLVRRTAIPILEANGSFRRATGVNGVRNPIVFATGLDSGAAPTVLAARAALLRTPRIGVALPCGQ